ncbi:hypothetical protein, partial [Accumulibacter sp.]|uniref:hypothetical protein n=1 Tax=Accumulibacter sp. TaxID=2053492 RepID=UPI0025D1CAA9
HDPLLPKQMRYQAALRPEGGGILTPAFRRVNAGEGVRRELQAGDLQLGIMRWGIPVTASTTRGRQSPGAPDRRVQRATRLDVLSRLEARLTMARSLLASIPRIQFPRDPKIRRELRLTCCSATGSRRCIVRKAKKD